MAKMFSAINSILKFGYPLLNNDSQGSKASCFSINPGLAHVVLNLGGLQQRKLSKSSTLDLPGTLGHRLVLSVTTSESSASVERMVPLFDDPVDNTQAFP